jgi:hypothetical protein
LAHEIEIDKVAVVLRWRNVVERLTALIAANVVHGAERMIVDDFLQFVDEEFPYLNPYDTFGQCKNSASLLERRCRSILEAVAPGRVEWQPKWGTYYLLLDQPSPVKMCGLYPRVSDSDGHRIEAAIYPGDSMAQARALFTHLRRHGADRLLALEGRGWDIAPNFHFGFIRRGFGHGVRTRLSLEEYIQFWTEHPIEQVSLTERSFEAALQDFVGTGMMNHDDIGKVVNALPSTARNFNVIPGIKMLFEWPLNRAVEIDRQCRMIEEFKRTVNDALATCGCEPVGMAEAARSGH